jgi:hypothetical protein
VAVVWVDFQGTPAQARTVVRHNHLTFPVVVDHSSTSTKTWAIQTYPYWLLLDRHGNVVWATGGGETNGLSMIIFDSEENARAAGDRIRAIAADAPDDVTLDGTEVREVVASA